MAATGSQSRPLATMAFFMPTANQDTTPSLLSCSASMTRAPNQTRVSHALFSDSTSSQSMVPVMISTNRPRKATTVGSSTKAGPNSICGTLAHSSSIRPKVPSITRSLPDSGPMRAISLRAYSTARSEEHTSELQSPCNLVCRLLLEKKKQPPDVPPLQYRPDRAAAVEDLAHSTFEDRLRWCLRIYTSGRHASGRTSPAHTPPERD